MNQALFFLPSQPFSISYRKLLPVLSLQPWGLSTVDCWVIWTQNTRTPSLAPAACSQELAGEPGFSVPVPGSGGSLLMAFVFAEKLSKVDGGEERKVQ